MMAKVIIRCDCGSPAEGADELLLMNHEPWCSFRRVMEWWNATEGTVPGQGVAPMRSMSQREQIAACVEHYADLSRRVEALERSSPNYSPASGTVCVGAGGLSAVGGGSGVKWRAGQ